MDVRTMGRVTRMAAGLRARSGGGGSGRGRLGGIAAVALAALAMAAPAWPAAAQDTLQDLFPDEMPLAVAYLAAPYAGTLKGPSAIFAIGAEPPGSALLPRLLKPEKKEPWEGEQIELFKGNKARPHERLSFEGSTLGLGGSTPLSLRLYVFVREDRRLTISRVRAWDSDAWSSKQKDFSILSDTSFQLEATIPSGSTTFTEMIACVNTRSRPPVCDGDTGSVIEDPLSGQPALLMVARDGPPEWLEEVWTEICVDRQKDALIRLPDSAEPVSLTQKVGERWCSPRMKLNYLALLEKGLRLGNDPPIKRLDSRFAPKSDKEWRMLADRPQAIEIAGKIWVQRLTLYPPAVKDIASPPSGFGLALAGQSPAAAGITKLWYGPIPASADGEAKCENQHLVLGGVSRRQDDLYLAKAIRVEPPGGRQLKVTEAERGRMAFKVPFAVIAQAGSTLYCGVARPVPGEERAFKVALVPGSAPSQPKTAATEGKGKTETSEVKSPQPPAPTSRPAPVVAPVAPGSPVQVVFKSPDVAAAERLKHAAGRVQNDNGIFDDVDRKELRFTLPPHGNLVISECNVVQPLSCRIDGQDIELLPKEGSPLPKGTRRVVVNVKFGPRSKTSTLVFAADGHAGLRLQQVSGGKITELQKLTGSTSAPSNREQAVDWKAGDRIKVTLEDPLVYKMKAVTADNAELELRSDVEIEIPITEALKAISIATDHRLFSGPVSVTARGGKVAVAHGETPLETVEDGASKNLRVDDARLGDILTVRPVNPEFELAKITLHDGQKPTPVGAPAPSFSLRLDRSHVRPGGKLAALSLEAEVREIPVLLPTDVLLKPAIRLGTGLLALQSCKVGLSRGDARFSGEHTSKGTLLKFGPGQSVPQSGRYTVEFDLGASPPAVCRGVVAEGLIAAAAFKTLGPDRVLKVPLRRPGSRAFVGIVNLSKELRSKEQNWRAALEAVKKAFEAANEKPMDGAGERKGKYIWRAIYGPDGKALIKSETADETELPVGDITGSTSTMERLTDGSGLQSLETLLILAGKDVADFEGNVDMLIVSDTQRGICGWSSPPYSRGGRAALVRLAGFSTVKDDASELKGTPGVRVCNPAGLTEKAAEKTRAAGIVTELEMVPGEWSSGVLPHVQLERAIAEAAKRLFSQ